MARVIKFVCPLVVSEVFEALTTLKSFQIIEFPTILNCIEFPKGCKILIVNPKALPSDLNSKNIFLRKERKKNHNNLQRLKMCVFIFVFIFKYVYEFIVPKPAPHWW